VKKKITTKFGRESLKDAHCNTSAMLFTTWWVQGCSKKIEGGQKKAYMEMDEGGRGLS
jgi:hypothetical protein